MTEKGELWPIGLSEREVHSIWDLFETAQTKTYIRNGGRNGQRYNSNCPVCNQRRNVSNFEIYDNNSQVSLHLCNRCLPSIELLLPREGQQRGSLQFAELVTHLHSLGLKRTNQEQQEQATIEEEAEPYIKSGLAETFAIALVKSEKPEEILNLWEAKWWKQYEPDDILITSVLDETLTEQEARSINEFRGEHRALAMACIKKQITTEWAEMLLESGFDAHPDAVLNVLEGADPMLIARIRGMEVKDVPPPTGIRILMGENSK